MTAANVQPEVLPWITVVTTPRRPDYLAATVTGIDAAGGAEWKGQKILYVDGNPDELKWRPSAGWQISGRGKNFRGNAINSLRVLRDAMAANVPYVLFFEDDVKLVKYAIPVMASLAVPADCWALQFCDLRSFGDPRSDEIRIFRQAIKDFINKDCDPKLACTMWGDQGLKIPMRTLKLISESKIPNTWESRQGPHHADVMFSLISLEQKEAPYLGIVAPSLVQHAGLKSLCNEGRNLTDRGRAARNFPGEDFDARSLLKNADDGLT